MIPSYPKIFHIGDKYIPLLFEGEVEITEKIDGSMFAFGLDETGSIVMRSKGKELFPTSYEKMFEKAVAFVIDREQYINTLPKGTFFYGEFLEKPKHNVLCYTNVPENGIVLFGCLKEGKWLSWEELFNFSVQLNCDVVPMLYRGKILRKEDLDQFHEKESYLGNTKVEGVVIKNYNQNILLGGQVYPVFAKYVRAEFKETLNTTWTSGKDKVQEFIDSFRTEARWQKAIQHMRELGTLEENPRDIGNLLKEIEQDIWSEEEENIKNGLFKLFKDQIKRKAVAGFPEWYKSYLTDKQFEQKDSK